MQVYTSEQGEKLVKNARYTIELLLTSPKFTPELIEKRLAEFDQRHGVFVTLASLYLEAVRSFFIQILYASVQGKGAKREGGGGKA